MTFLSRMASAGSVITLAALGMILGHWLSGRLELLPGASAEPPGAAIRAQRIELVDQQGRRRAVMGIGGEGSPALWFFDQEGKSRLNLGVYGDGDPFIVLNDNQERAVEIFRTVNGGTPVLVMKSEGRDRIIMGLDGAKDPFLAYYDASGTRRTLFGK